MAIAEQRLSALHQADPQLASLLEAELDRQQYTLELIPSENVASPAVLEAVGSWLTNKYAEGTPGKRYYGGCEFVDQIETLAQERACRLFGAEHANVQPHCGSAANMAAYMAFCQPGDTILGLDLSHGGHLTHGSPVSFSGIIYHAEFYGVNRETEQLDYEEIRRRAREVRPRVLVAGASAYPRTFDFVQLAEIAHEVDAILMVDMAHFAGLVAGGAHPSPVPYADVVTLTTHKTLRGPWGGMILSPEEHAKAIDKAVFPGVQGGPLLHAIAGKAAALHAWSQPEMEGYAQRVVANAQRLAAGLLKEGLRLVSGGTDNHLMLIDLRPLGRTGKEVQEVFDRAHITVNRNSIPFDEASKFNPSGIRLGTPAVTTRGMGLEQMDEIAAMISRTIHNLGDAAVEREVAAQARTLCEAFPLPYR
ncbi:MAG TPA: serine hydroxymethyltransferase [Candidatus Dormibacteraeota bacterium]|nr:serine hydroxymethyltransferase [Candidatus Dormibacteraeota bacterium]